MAAFGPVLNAAMSGTSQRSMSARLLAALLLSSTLAGAQETTLRYDPPEDADLERPVAREVTVTTQGPNYALQVVFDREPWGEECRTQCANATFFLDTDGNTATGLKVGDKAPETGADISVTIQGVRHYDGTFPTPVLRAKVRRLSGNPMDEASVMAEYDHRKDTDRIQSDGKEVFVLVDATSASIPSGAKVRLIYHPPGAEPRELVAPGLRAGKGARVQVGDKAKKKK